MESPTVQLFSLLTPSQSQMATTSVVDQTDLSSCQGRERAGGGQKETGRRRQGGSKEGEQTVEARPGSCIPKMTKSPDDCARLAAENSNVYPFGAKYLISI